MSQKYNSEYVNENEAFFIGRNDIINRLGNINSHYSMLPGIIGYWNMANVQRSTGNVPNYIQEYTGATKQDLVYNGNPVFNYTATGVPYIDFDGTGDYLSIADNTDLDVLGTETQYANPGLTLGGWFWNDTLVNFSWLIAKDNNTGNRPFTIFSRSTGVVTFRAGNGVTTPGVNSSNVIATGEWYFVVGRYIPSTSTDIYLNGIKSTNTVGITANLLNGADSLTIGATQSATNTLNGRATLQFLCASALSDAIIQSLFQQTRLLFGV